MQENLSISKATVDRLPRYYRCLRQLTDEGVEIASSEELGRRLAINPEQIRKDLAFFGQFGKKGVGYYVAELKESIGNILGLDQHWNVAIIGMGHLGAALANYQGIARLGFHLVAIFDVNPVVIGTRVGERRVEDIAYLAEIIAERDVQIGVIAVPATHAQSGRQTCCGGHPRHLELCSGQSAGAAEHSVCQRRSVGRAQFSLVLSDTHECGKRGVIRQKFKQLKLICPFFHKSQKMPSM